MKKNMGIILAIMLVCPCITAHGAQSYCYQNMAYPQMGYEYMQPTQYYNYPPTSEMYPSSMNMAYCLPYSYMQQCCFCCPQHLNQYGPYHYAAQAETREIPEYIPGEKKLHYEFNPNPNRDFGSIEREFYKRQHEVVFNQLFKAAKGFRFFKKLISKEVSITEAIPCLVDIFGKKAVSRGFSAIAKNFGIGKIPAMALADKIIDLQLKTSSAKFYAADKPGLSSFLTNEEENTIIEVVSRYMLKTQEGGILGKFGKMSVIEDSDKAVLLNLVKRLIQKTFSCCQK